MKYDKVVVAIIAATVALGILVGVLTIYGRSTADDKKIVEDYNKTSNPSILMPITIKQIKAMDDELIDMPDITVPGTASGNVVVPISDKQGADKIVDQARLLWASLVANDMHYSSPPTTVGTDCSQYVFDVLKTCGFMNTKLNSQGWVDSRNNPPAGFAFVGAFAKADVYANAQAGDIFAWYGGHEHHVQIYAGDGKSYSWGGRRFTTVDKTTYDLGFPANAAAPPSNSLHGTTCYIFRYVGGY